MCFTCGQFNNCVPDIHIKWSPDPSSACRILKTIGAAERKRLACKTKVSYTLLAEPADPNEQLEKQETGTREVVPERLGGEYNNQLNP